MPEERPKTVDVNYIKSAGFREVACDGALGGPTPQGKLWLAFYTERYPLPRIVRHEVIDTADGRAWKPNAASGSLIDGREGIVRNIEAGVYLTAETAADLRDWLNEQLKKLAGDENG